MALLPLRIVDPGRFFVVPRAFARDEPSSTHPPPPCVMRRAKNNTHDHLIPAQHNHESPSTDEHDGEGVKTVALFESRKGRETRAWDELSEIDRAVLLESVRQRRKVQQQKQTIYTQVHGIRSIR